MVPKGTAVDDVLPPMYLANPQSASVKWRKVGNVASKLTGEMREILDAGGIIAGGAALGLLTDRQYGDIDYYVSIKDLDRVQSILEPKASMVSTTLAERMAYSIVYKWCPSDIEGPPTSDGKESSSSNGVMEHTKMSTHIPKVSSGALPSRVAFPKIYRKVSGPDPEPPLTYQSATDVSGGETMTPIYRDTIDIIPTGDENPRDFVAREFDLSICKTYVNETGDVYALYPQDIFSKQVTQIFDPHMLYNRAKVKTLGNRLKKYIARGYKYYEHSRLYARNIPSPLTFGHGHTDDERAGELFSRALASHDPVTQKGSLFLSVYDRIVESHLVAKTNKSQSEPFEYGGRTFGPHRAWKYNLHKSLSEDELTRSFGRPPTSEDLDLALAVIDKWGKVYCGYEVRVYGVGDGPVISQMRGWYVTGSE